MRKALWTSAAVLAIALPVSWAAAQSGWMGEEEGGLANSDLDLHGFLADHGAGHGGPSPMHGPGTMSHGGQAHLGALQRLDLTDRQKEQIKKIHESGQAEQLTFRKQVMRLQNRLHGEMLEEQPSRARVIELAEQIADVRGKLQVMHVSKMLEVRDLLTPEQRDRLFSMGGRMGMRGRHGRNGRMGRHGPMDDGLGPRRDRRPGLERSR